MGIQILLFLARQLKVRTKDLLGPFFFSLFLLLISQTYLKIDIFFSFLTSWFLFYVLQSIPKVFPPFSFSPLMRHEIFISLLNQRVFAKYKTIFDNNIKKYWLLLHIYIFITKFINIQRHIIFLIIILVTILNLEILLKSLLNFLFFVNFHGH